MSDPPDGRGSYRPPVPGRVNLRTGADGSQFPPLPPPDAPERRIWHTPLIIGVLADTHMPGRARDLPPPVVATLREVDLILHAGDINTLDAMERIRRIGPPVLAVRGNVDVPELWQTLPVQRVVTIGKKTAENQEQQTWRIGITHGNGGGSAPEAARRSFSEVDCVIFGHNHTPMNEVVDGVLMFNPGSPTDRRREPFFSYGLLRVTETGITGEILRFQKG